MDAQTKLAMQALLAVALALVITSSLCRVAGTDSTVDCSRLSRWSYAKTYERGDVVWYDDGPYYANKARCISDGCRGVPAFSTTWKKFGACAKRPAL
ncbi:MAG TPA: hypothetical protein VH143_24680 [Kofleriaceae bacterium]|jgi:hypothetical protein|nr:hypothetical protein [Kofleriaceae bacterium]